MKKILLLISVLLLAGIVEASAVEDGEPTSVPKKEIMYLLQCIKCNKRASYVHKGNSLCVDCMKRDLIKRIRALKKEKDGENKIPVEKR